MKIDGKKLAEEILVSLKKEVAKLKKKPHLAVFLVNGSSENISFVNAKKEAVKKIGGEFTLINYDKTPDFMEFALKLKEVAFDPKITGIIIQKPLPSTLNTDSIFNYLPDIKEIEGHKKKTTFYPPLGLAVLTALKYAFKPFDAKNTKELIINPKKDFNFFKKIFKRKKIVLIGTGETAGKPLSKFLNELKINFINTNSKTPTPEYFYKEADIIITAAGKQVLNKENIKLGATLINIGSRKENNKTKGDFEENDIANIAGFYTTTPGGVGPLDVAYLTYNLFLATKAQK